MEAGPKLLLSTAPFYRLPLRTAFAHAREAGYRGVEVMVTSDPASQDSERIRGLAEEFDLSVEALHAPFLLMTRRVWGTDPIEKIYRATQVAEGAEIPLIVVHPPYHWQVRYRRWVGTSLTEYSARSGVTIAVENMFPIKIRGDRGLRFHASQDFEELDRFPQLALDTSHLAVARFDILEAYRRYKEKVVHFHLSNNAGRGWDSHLPVDQGVLPIDKLLETAAADGFGGSLSLELDLRPYLSDGTSLKELLIRNREFCEARLGVRA
ncbi:MAG TPA: sugar phosphate isomerase/epimerase family protein [Actinomycetota bacterium]|nr:sugar phosphate isomerase/epimerase family protein [Actinomycetota bacterium]